MRVHSFLPLTVVALAGLVACTAPPTRPPELPKRTSPPPTTNAPPRAEAVSRIPAVSGSYYLDDGPAIAPPPHLATLPDPPVRSEPLHRFANNPYSALGQDFVPDRTIKPFHQRGLASWYGRRFHGNKTATGEIYDMFQFSAAHPTLPLPSYARVTNVQNGRQVVVRVNDRGPFLRNRVMDLSYAAAVKLGYMEQGVALIEVETIVPDEVDRLASTGTPTPAGGSERMLEINAHQKGLPMYAEPNGVFVQIGAFLVAGNAEAMRARLTLELSSIVHSIQLVTRNGMHRLWVGPYATMQDARTAAEQIAHRFQ